MAQLTHMSSTSCPLGLLPLHLEEGFMGSLLPPPPWPSVGILGRGGPISGPGLYLNKKR